MASDRQIAIACEALIWQHGDEDDEPEIKGVHEDSKKKLAELIDATALTMPSPLRDEGIDDEDWIHRAVLDVMGAGVGLWDDYHKEWAGFGKAWSAALRASFHMRCESTLVDDDGLLHWE